MERFLRGLLLDLERRAITLLERLSDMDTEEDLRDNAIAAYVVLERIRRRVAGLARNPDLDSPQLIRNHLQLFKRWSETLSLIEWYPLPFLERHNDADRRLTRLAGYIAEQVEWPLARPLVGGFSSQYFWTKPEFSLICVPTGEGFNLLALPDLFHEMGHILLMHFEDLFVGEFVNELEDYFKKERRRIEDEQRPPGYKDLYLLLFVEWRDHWMWEFASDMIATYLTGAAFGWQHLRLCASSGRPAYYPSAGDVAEHPSDEARMRGVISILTRIGFQEEAVDLQRLWKYYVNMNEDGPSAEYEICYPQPLIENLAQKVEMACQHLKLRGFHSVQDDGGSIHNLIDEAWKQFMVKPDSYEEWDRGAQDRLWHELGFS